MIFLKKYECIPQRSSGTYELLIHVKKRDQKISCYSRMLIFFNVDIPFWQNTPKTFE
jgi:hypothetical protein